MKKLQGIGAAICIIAGLIIFLFAQVQIWGNPFNKLDADIQTTRFIGLALLICGVVDVIWLIFAKMYASKTVQDVNKQNFSTIECPGCGLRVSKSTTICPKCKHQLKEG